MRGAEHVDGQAGKRERIACAQGPHVMRILERAHLAAGSAHSVVRVHGRLDALLRQAAQHHAEALRVVGVVVRHEDGREPRRIEPGLVAAREEVALADAAVHEHARARGRVLHHGRVAAAAAGQHVQAQRARPTGHRSAEACLHRSRNRRIRRAVGHPTRLYLPPREDLFENHIHACARPSCPIPPGSVRTAIRPRSPIARPRGPSALSLRVDCTRSAPRPRGDAANRTGSPEIRRRRAPAALPSLPPAASSTMVP